jgi:hypothetical protein
MKKIIDIFRDYDNIIRHKGSVVEKNNCRVLLAVKSNSNSPGIFFKLKTNTNKKYKLSIRAKMTQGDKAFLYCETKDSKRLISRDNIINLHINRHDLFFNGDNSDIKIGILCFYKNIIYTIEIYKFVVYEIDYLDTDRFCLDQYVDKVFVINNNSDNLTLLQHKLKSFNTNYEVVSSNDYNNNLFINRYLNGKISKYMTILEFSRLIVHLNIVISSKINNYESIMILEDNIILNDSIEQYIDYIVELLNNNWGLLYLSSNNIPDGDLYSKIINENNSYSYCISHTVYDDLINLLSEFNNTLDNSLQQIQKKYECYAFKNTFITTNQIHNVKVDEIIEVIPNTRFKPKILISSTQYPFYGGAATNAYLLTKYFRENGYEVACIFFDNGNNTYDPDHIGGIFRMKYTSIYSSNDKILLKIRKYLNGDPDLIFSFNWFAPIISKRLYPYKCVLYCITGSTLITKISEDNISFIKFLEEYDEKSLVYQHSTEFEAMELSDLIVFNSYLTQNNFNRIYFNFNEKFVNMPLELTNVCINKNHIIPQDTIKEYDLIVVNSSYKRKIKNPEFLKKLFELPQIAKLKKIIIGKFSSEIFNGYNNTTTIDLIDNDTVYDYLSKSKILLVPSFLESAGIIIEEANYCKCSVLTTRNVGLSYRINNNFLCKDVYDTNEWENKIINILQNYNNITCFYDVNYYDNNKIFNFINNLIDIKLNPLFDKSVTIMVVSIDTPYIGGSSTNAYRLIKQLRKKGYYVFGLFIDKDETHITDPDEIGDIFRIFEYDDANVKLIRDTINNYIQDIDVMYVKNYITYYIVRSIFPEIKIIFSPSGSRAYSSYCGNNKFITYTEFMENDVKLKNDVNKYCYPTSCGNKCNCELLTVNDCDLIVPNSKLTYDLYKKIYSKHANKIYFPIYLSSIIDEKIYDDMRIDFNNRGIDVICIVYNWNRKVKNKELFKKIIDCDMFKSFKIVIIGYKFGIKFSNKNIDIIDHLENKDIMRYLGNSKVCVLTSYYDSNPNILNEADYMGCNIITTENTGIGKFLNDECLVKNYHDVKEWRTKINNSTKQKYDNNLPTIQEELNKFDHMIKYVIENPVNEKLDDFCVDTNKNICVLFHTIPAIWSTESYISNIRPKHNLNVHKCKDNIDQIIDFVNTDLYFNIIENINFKKDFEEIHIIRGNLNSKFDYIQLSDIYPNEYRHVYIWNIPDVDSLFAFCNAKLYFMRGKYDLLYDAIIKNSMNKPTTIFYPATSLPFNVDHQICETKYDIVLYSEPSNQDVIQKIYPESTMRLFLKSPTSTFYLTNKQRIYDACFCATYKQQTKNHSIFVKFINYLEENSLKINLIFIGGDITPKTKLLFHQLSIHRTFVNVKVLGKTNREELAKIYNQSNVNLLFSGRDDTPRVITESLFCGCYNIACDTLSDGKFMYQNKLVQMFPQYFDNETVNSVNDLNILNSNHILGELLRSKDYTTEKQHNISPILDNNTFKYLYQICKKEYDHRKIYRISKGIFNIYNSINDITTIL